VCICICKRVISFPIRYSSKSLLIPVGGSSLAYRSTPAVFQLLVLLLLQFFVTFFFRWWLYPPLQRPRAQGHQVDQNLPQRRASGLKLISAVSSLKNESLGHMCAKGFHFLSAFFGLLTFNFQISFKGRQVPRGANACRSHCIQ